MVDQNSLELANTINPNLNYVVGTFSDAQKALEIQQQNCLMYQSGAFSICSNIEIDDGVMWKTMRKEDPENGIYQVFDCFTGQYTQCSSKTEAINLNEQKKQQFLISCGLDKVYELNEIPQPNQGNL
jgi:hypothetical protein